MICGRSRGDAGRRSILVGIRAYPGLRSETWGTQVLQLVGDFAEVPDAGGLMGEPFSGAHGPQGEAAAGVGFVAEFEDVDIGRCRHHVFALGVADAVRGDFDFSTGLDGLNDFAQGDGGAGRGVDLGGVVDLGDGESVAVELGDFGGKAEELLYADGEISSVEK